MFRTYSLFFLFALIGNFVTSTSVYAEVSIEKLQAAFIFKFTNYIEWPSQNSNSFTIGVYDNPEMFNALKEAFEGKAVNKLPVTIISLKKLDKNISCHILILKDDEGASKELNQVKSSGLLTVSYNPQGIMENVVINFYLGNQDNLRFEINNVKAVENNLKINSRLLNLAKSSK